MVSQNENLQYDLKELWPDISTEGFDSYSMLGPLNRKYFGWNSAEFVLIAIFWLLQWEENASKGYLPLKVICQ